ncbi:uncharacterized protein N7479_001370 [Penicillium vulpinum]|uniref:uncharacterized protein n=1 Tax=Penicillium vulpinum TaxID=29845 RepID=UPI002547556E|nr:uncharacterized protein N7479_001370 [Penicillium vulpinum]KAJ5971452.1 hypothetical protein N7479_001370 [Penicillium vulpinum]
MCYHPEGPVIFKCGHTLPQGTTVPHPDCNNCGVINRTVAAASTTNRKFNCPPCGNKLNAYALPGQDFQGHLLTVYSDDYRLFLPRNFDAGYLALSIAKVLLAFQGCYGGSLKLWGSGTGTDLIVDCAPTIFFHLQ